MRIFVLLLLLLGVVDVGAQWDIHTSNTTSGLLSVHAVSDKVAWIGGTGGVILRTVDGGSVWSKCAAPAGADKLDFISVQGIDESAALAMSTGKGKLSRVYKTVDGCKTWKLTLTNPDASGLFRGMRHVTGEQVYLLGDPVEGKFAVFYSSDGGATWLPTGDAGLDAEKGEVGFSVNDSLISVGPFLFFGSRTATSTHLYHTFPNCAPEEKGSGNCPIGWTHANVPMTGQATESGGFSLAARTQLNMKTGALQTILVAVGASPSGAGWAGTSKDDGKTWIAATTPPSGSRTGVVYLSQGGMWVAVGPDGTDVSPDDGQKWRALQPQAGQDWSAVSLPFAVGAEGRIGRLNPVGLKK